MPVLQLPIPWALRILVRQPLTHVEELLEVLSRDAEPLVAQWARALRGRVREVDDLAVELQRLEHEGGPVAVTLVWTVRRAWTEFGGLPLPAVRSSTAQPPLPLS